MASRFLYLPIDVKTRELDAKLMLALLGAQRGWQVVLGQKKEVSHAVSHLPPGVFIGFGAHKNFAGKFEKIKKRGGIVAVFDEEGLVTWNADVFGKMRVSSETAPFIDTYFCWGQAHADIIGQVDAGLSGKCVVTGNPRLDILKPEFAALHAGKAREIRQNHGDFILINSNFGTCNHYMGKDAYFESLKEKQIITSPEREQFYRDYIDYRSRILDAFCALLPKLSAAFPDNKIIVRPHPSENQQKWLDAAQGLTNVAIIHEGAVIPWLIAARAVVHNFCTTAIEAFCLNRPVIAYRPVIDSRLETELPSIVSRQVFDDTGLLQALADILAQPDAANSQTVDVEKVGHYIANLGHEQGASRMLDTLEQMVGSARDNDTLSVLRFRLRNIREKLLARLTRHGDQKTAYIKHKFPPLEMAEIKHLMSLMPTSYTQGVAMTPLHNGTYLFRKGV